jgi:hypothetical protein
MDRLKRHNTTRQNSYLDDVQSDCWDRRLTITISLQQYYDVDDDVDDNETSSSSNTDLQASNILVFTSFFSSCGYHRWLF